MDGDIYLLGSYYPSVSLAEKNAADYPKLASAIKNYSDSLDASMKSQKETLIPEAKENDSAETFQAYYLDASVTFKRADSTAVSFLEATQSYTGGVHDNSVYVGHSFDAASGQEMKLTDVMPDISSLPKTLAAKLQEKYPDVSFTDLQKTLEDQYLADGGSNFSWTLGCHELIFYFSPYDIAPFAAGLLTVTVPFSESPELFNTAYTAAPKTYVEALTMGEAQDVYTDDSGTPVPLKAEFDAGENSGTDTGDSTDADPASYSDTGKRIITLGTESFSLETNNYAYSFDPYFIHLADGRNFLYLSCSAEDDYESIEVFKIDGGTVSYVGVYDNAGMGLGGFTNPDYFTLTSRLDLLSTYSGTRTHHIGDDGIPVSDSDAYSIDADIVLTSKADISAALLDSSYQSAGETVTVPAGTEFTLSRTDGKTYVDTVLSDGRICRLTVVNDSWPQTVGGEDIENLFDGLRFAG